MKRSNRKPMFTRRRRHRLARTVVALALLAGVTGGYLALRGGSDEPSAATKAVAACDISSAVLQRVWDGYVPGRSGDVLAIERLPNQFGSRHSTPFPYTQDVPIVLYGPGYIKKGVTSDRSVTLADIAPTYADLLNFDAFPKRDGSPLQEALLPPDQRNGVPKLIFTLVWDGGGDNVLKQWPDQWPELAKLMSEGTSYSNATVASSPSITPATHATLGTGAFPKTHGLSDIRMRIKGEMVDAWEETSPRYLRIKTFADLWDAANGNAPLVGLLARDAWHLGMLGHGAYLPEGDHDIAVLDDLGTVGFRTNPAYYSMPDYMTSLDGLDAAAHEVDLRDGQADQRWLGNPMLAQDALVRFTPAWSIFQTERIKALLEGEGFGRDGVPDLFFTNYKSTDLAGHYWSMVEPEERDDLAEQDAQIPLIVRELDRIVGRDNYVLALTADHGQQPPTTTTGGWSINTAEMTKDMEHRFDKVTPDTPIVLSNRSYQLVLNHDELKRNHVTSDDIAAFVRSYTLGENVSGTTKVPSTFAGKTDERLFLTALSPDKLKAALDCAVTREASASPSP